MVRGESEISLYFNEQGFNEQDLLFCVCELFCCVFFGFVFVTRDFKMQWFPRLGRENRVKGRCFGFFSQEPYPVKLKPGGVVFLALCGIHSTSTDTIISVNNHIFTAIARVQVEMEKAKVPRGQNWKYKW